MFIMTQYRKYYADFYGITWDHREMEVHHIDYDHDNNDIGNLILIPRWLHRALHATYSETQHVLSLRCSTTNDFMKALAREHLRVGMSLIGDALEKHIEVLANCSHWCLLKNVRYNTPTGVHIEHITPDTRLFG